MKKIYAFLIIIFIYKIGFTFNFHQSDSILKTKKNNIKINPLTLIGSVVDLFYERKINKRISTETNISFGEFNAIDSGNINSNSFRFEIVQNIKFFIFQKQNNINALFGTYLSLGAGYKYIKYNVGGINGGYESVILRGVLGYQLFLKSRFILDFGGGLTSYTPPVYRKYGTKNNYKDFDPTAYLSIGYIF